MVQHGDGVYRADGGRQDGAHPHQVAVAPDNRHVLVCDLGLDLVVSYRFDAKTGALERVSQAATPSGAGPRHLSFSPDGSHAAVVNELDNTVCVFAYDSASGALSLRQTVSALPADFNAPPPFDFYTVRQGKNLRDKKEGRTK